MVGFFACIHHAALRPGEVIHLRKENCILPETGWGKLMLGGSTQYAGAWGDNGESAPSSTSVRPAARLRVSLAQRWRAWDPGRRVGRTRPDDMRSPRPVFSLIRASLASISSGGRGIRTLEELAPLAVFKTAALGHYASPPRWHGIPAAVQLDQPYRPRIG
jgi:hypothetical protein